MTLRRAALRDTAPSAGSIMLLSFCGALAAGEGHALITVTFMAVLAWVGLLNVHRVALLANALDDAVVNSKARAARDANVVVVEWNGPGEEVEAFRSEGGALVLRWGDTWLMREPGLRFSANGTPVHLRREDGTEVRLQIAGLDPEGYPLLSGQEGSTT